MSPATLELNPSQVQCLLASHSLACLSCDAAAGALSLPVRYSMSGRDHVCVHVPTRARLAFLAVNMAVRLEVDEIDGPASWSTVIGWGIVEGARTPCGERATYDIRLTTVRGFHRRPTCTG